VTVIERESFQGSSCANEDPRTRPVHFGLQFRNLALDRVGHVDDE
jgi:hypothetical protein